jgi:hypothetical protein
MKNLTTRLALAGLMTAALTACSEDSVSTDQEEHLEPVAIALENHETEEIVAILFDEEALPDSTSRTSLTLDVGDTLELHVVPLCEHDAELAPCELEAHDHDGEEHADEDAEYTIAATISDVAVADLHVHAAEFELELIGLAAGTAHLDVEILHGSHADISGKTFELMVQ